MARCRPRSPSSCAVSWIGTTAGRRTLYGAAALAARVESYRLKGVAQAALAQVQLVAGELVLVAAANEAFKLTRPIHYAQDSADLDARIKQAEKAVNRFVTLAATELQSVRIGGRDRRSAAAD